MSGAGGSLAGSGASVFVRGSGIHRDSGIFLPSRGIPTQGARVRGAGALGVGGRLGIAPLGSIISRHAAGKPCGERE